MLSIALCAPAGAGPEAVQRFDRSLAGWPIEEFRLVDQHGEAFGRERLLGRWTFVLVGDRRCAAACAGGLFALDGLTRRIHQSDAILSTQVLFVPLDPAQDARAALRRVLAPYDKDWIGATGSLPVLLRLADDLGLAGGGQDGSLALVDPQGFLHTRYLPPFDVPRLTAHFLKTRALY